MYEQILKSIKINDRENLGIIKLILYLILTLFSIFIQNMLGYLFLLIFIAINSYQIATLEERCGMESIVVTTATEKENILWIKFTTSVINNSIGLFSLFLVLFLAMDTSIWLAILISMVTFLYAITAGICIGKLIKNQIIGISIICLYFKLTSGDMRYINQESIRYFCPILSLNDINEIYGSNILGLISCIILFMGIAFLFYTMDTKKGKLHISIFFISFCLLISLGIYRDMKFNKQIENMPYETMEMESLSVFYKGVEKQEILYLVKTALSYKGQIEKYNLPNLVDTIICDKQFIFPWKKIQTFQQVDNKLLIHYISPEMLKPNDINRLVDISSAIFQRERYLTEIQNIVVDIIRDQLISSTLIDNEYKIFSEESIEIGKMMKEQGYEALVYQANHVNNPVPYILDWFFKYKPDKIREIFQYTMEYTGIERPYDFVEMIKREMPEEYKEIQEQGEVSLEWNGEY
ncbi:hypothetical protein RBU61_03655 [Tissierella sp. MB52-C2]|uniref:hypothetical protein n=1 Tax=Tissierella sp. MB52-C2 TaxID=3070999 RepID=UPI00280AF9E7|nr:hypothetical protein [Tissierella sp. MB52-C2]WMM25776.1 hypothetical protein RBU61_03655 [Tissierella sp. MB52-C2]